MIYPKILIILATLFFSISCQTQSNTKNLNSLAEVRINGRSARFFIPGCTLYDQIPPHLLLTLPSMQEAQLSGYRAAAGCPKEILDERLRREIEIVGKLPPTKETDERKTKVILQKSIKDLNNTDN